MKGRELGQCLRCGSPAPNGDWHHRRGKSVKDEHTHCPCNGVWLCRTCHSDVHLHPFNSRTDGFIVSRAVADPGTAPVKSHFGTLLMNCDGSFTYYIEESHGTAT